MYSYNKIDLFIKCLYASLYVEMICYYVNKLKNIGI